MIAHLTLFDVEGESQLGKKNILSLLKIALVDCGIFLTLFLALYIAAADIFDDAHQLIRRSGTDSGLILLLAELVALDDGYGDIGNTLNEGLGLISTHNLADIVIFTLYGDIELGTLIIPGHHEIIALALIACHALQLYDILYAAYTVIHFYYIVTDLIHAAPSPFCSPSYIGSPQHLNYNNFFQSFQMEIINK